MPFLGDDIEKYQEAFENWYYEETKGETFKKVF